MAGHGAGRILYVDVIMIMMGEKGGEKRGEEKGGEKGGEEKGGKFE